MKVSYHIHSVYPYSSIETREYKDPASGETYYTYDGYTQTKHGRCSIYQSQFLEKKKYVWHTSLSFIWNGKDHTKTISGKQYTKIGLARKAGEFIREVISKN